jgi:CheY-like chemotaxis protein
VIREVLRESGLNLRFHVVPNGHDALLDLQGLAGAEKSSRPSVVLLDLNLPKISGIEFLQKLRAEPDLGCTPVIVVTSSTAAEDREAVKRLGAEAYFQKPHSLAAFSELGALVRNVLTSVTGDES